MKKIIILGLLLVFAVSGCSLIKPKTGQVVIGLEAAKQKAEKFINENLMQPGSNVTIKEAVEENDLYKITVVMSNGQEIPSYMTKDGKKFFPQTLDIAEIEKKNEEKNNAPAAEADSAASVVEKSDKPKVELFVMSHCPYGTQIEKGIIPAVEALGDKIDFTLKFCDYAMHGKKELDEQLTQHCIQQEGLDKLIVYLKCFLKADDSGSCIKEVGVDGAKLQSCVSETDKQYKVTEKFNDKTTWSSGQFPTFDVDKADAGKYGVKGSPSLIINGQQASSSRDSAGLLKVICSAFNNQPEACSQTLSSTAPSAGFGEGAASDSGGGCGG
ncbi:MAG: lipoprotein [bacterium]|nr:lipoprotein [bacterium]